MPNLDRINKLQEKLLRLDNKKREIKTGLNWGIKWRSLYDTLDKRLCSTMYL